MNNTAQRQKGFTIIETVLVLAIAGLIFLMVFVALPQLQKSRRDTQRRKDIDRALAALDAYATDNDGNYPDNQVLTNSFKAAYIPNFTGPASGTIYAMAYGTAAPTITGNIIYRNGAKCGTNGALTTTGAGSKNIAMAMKLENGFYCQDNN